MASFWFKVALKRQQAAVEAIVMSNRAMATSNTFDKYISRKNEAEKKEYNVKQGKNYFFLVPGSNKRQQAAVEAIAMGIRAMATIPSINTLVEQTKLKKK